MRQGKNPTEKNSFYYKVFYKLKQSTNLTKIRQDLNISKQNLNYYLNKLKEKGYISQKGDGWYEVKKGKNLTEYENLIPKDFTRGHAYVWNIYLPKEVKNWVKRAEILKKNQVNVLMVGALKNIPRIKAAGRKVWLCNDHLRIFDKKGKSYYGENAIESKKLALEEILYIIKIVENKLGINLRPFDIRFMKEHYALVKNDLAIDCNRKGIILRISDEHGEWLLMDDSLEQGGEAENTGKDAFGTNLAMQEWWNDHKKTDFKVTPTFLMESIGQVTANQQIFNKNIALHQRVLEKIGKGVEDLAEAVKELKK